MKQSFWDYYLNLSLILLQKIIQELSTKKAYTMKLNIIFVSLILAISKWLNISFYYIFYYNK